MTLDDLQERYRNKRGEIKPKAVPLAADAAHLLTDYLDRLCIELVRAGLREPYRITREYEEIFVQELQQKSSTTKLTYEVTSSMLEKYGTPVKLAKHHIAKNNPELDDNPSLVEDKLVRDKQYSLFWEVTIGLTLLLIIGYQLFLVLTLPLVLYQFNEVMVSYVFVIFYFLFLELIQGLTGSTGLRPRYYHKLRETIRFFSTVLVLGATVGLLDLFDFGSNENVTYVNNSWLLFFFTWLGIYGLDILKDHTDLLLTTMSREKPFARIFLPSYLMFGLSVVLGFVALIMNFDAPPVYNPTTSLMFLSLLVALGSLALDYRRRYPLSVKKIGYTIAFGIYLPIFIHSYIEFHEFYYPDINFNWGSFLPIILIYVVLSASIVALVFRHEINSQLERYQLQLKDYQG